MSTGTKINGSVTLGATDPYPPDNLHHVFTFSDGAKIAFFAGSDGAYYALRSNTGTWQTPVKWSSTTIMTSRPTFFSAVGDTVSCFYPNTATPAALIQTQFPYTASSHTMGTIVTTPAASISFASQGRNRGYASWQALHGQWDASRSVWHLAIGVTPSTGGSVIVVVAVTNGSATAAPGISWTIDQIWTTGSNNAWLSLRSKLSTSGNILYVTVCDNSRTELVHLPVSIGTGAYTFRSTQGEVVLYRGVLHGTELDSSGNLDIVAIQNPTSGIASLYAIKRTGTATYSTTIPLQNGSLDTTYSHPVTCYDVHTGNLTVFYYTTAVQPHGEVYCVQRIGGVWQAPQLIAGGDASGYIHPTAAANFDSSSGTNGTADLLFVQYYTGGPAAALYYLGVGAGATPNTPTNPTPSGTLTGTSPTYAWTYSNPSPNDTQYAWEVKVVRTSDSHVMWDSGWVTDQTSYLAANVSSGGTTITVPHGAGAVFQAGQQVLVGTGASIEVLQVSSITPGSGSNPDTVTFTTNLAHSHNANDPVTTGGTVSSAIHGQISNTADSNYAAPTALSYGTQYQWQVRTQDLNNKSASSYASATVFVPYHTPGPTITDVLSNGVTLTGSGTIGAPLIDVTFSYSQSEGNAAASYVLNLLAADQTTVLDSTAAAISLASGSSYTIPTWDISGATTDGQQYYLQLVVTDSQGLVGSSALFGILASWATPPQAIQLAVVADPATGQVNMNWQNLSDNFVPNGDFETLSGGLPIDWTGSSSGGGSTAVVTDNTEPGSSDTVVKCVAASASQQASWTSTPFTIPAGSTAYACSLWVKALAAGTVRVVLTWFDASDTNLGTTTEDLPVTTSWAQTGFVINPPPATAASATIQIGYVGQTYGTVEIDKVQLETGLIVTDYRNNGVGIVESTNVLMRPSTGGDWTTLSSGSLRTALVAFPQLLTAFDYAVQSVSALGVASDPAIVGNISLPLKDNAYGIWYHDTTDPLNARAAIGLVDSWDTFAVSQHNKDVTSWVPPGFQKPIEIYGLANWYAHPQRKYYIPGSDSGVGGAISGLDVVNALKSMWETSNPVLYRDKDGAVLIVTLKNGEWYPVDNDNYLVQIDGNEVYATITVVVV